MADAPDYTLLSDVNVIGSVTLDVNVVGSVTINTNITGVESGVTFDVAITSSTVTLDVNVTNASLDVNATIVSSTVTLDVNVTNASLTVNIGAPLTTDGNVATAIQESIQLDVNIAASSVTLDVAIQSSAVTLDVNIASSAVTLDVSITNATVTLNVSVTNEVLQSKLAKPALAFNGENAYVDYGDILDFAGTSPFTIVIYAYLPPYNGVFRRIVTKEYDSPDGRQGWDITTHDSSNQITFQRWRDGAHEDAVVSYEPGWHVIQGVYDGSTIKVRIDKGSWSSTSSTLEVKDHDKPLRLGLRFDGTRPFDGKISVFLAYDRALSDSELDTLVDNLQSPITNGLQLWCNFDEGSGTTAYDKSGNGNHGTIYNAVWVSEQGQVAPLLNVNLTASQITMDVNVTNSVLNIQGNVEITNAEINVNITNSIRLNINIDAQNVGLYLIQSWMAKQVSDVNEYGSASIAAGSSATLICYEVPAGKTLYVNFLNVTPRTAGYNYYANLTEMTGPTHYLAIGEDRAYVAEFDKPLRFTEGQIVEVTVTNLSGYDQWFYATLLGWLE